MVVALAALFVALGGSSYAAVQLSKNSVSSKHIKNGQVKKADLANNSVNTAKVADGALLAEDFGAGQLPAGPKGDKGDKGDPGANGTNGTNGTNGANGADGQNGLDGAALDAQARCSGCPQQSGAANTFVPVPLSDNQWAQDTNEANVLFVQFTWTPPAGTCVASSGPGPGGQVNVKVDGNVVATSQRPAGSGEAVDGAVPPPYLFAPGAPENHTVTVEVADNCNGTENATVSDVKVDVASLLG